MANSDFILCGTCGWKLKMPSDTLVVGFVRNPKPFDDRTSYFRLRFFNDHAAWLATLTAAKQFKEDLTMRFDYRNTTFTDAGQGERYRVVDKTSGQQLRHCVFADDSTGEYAHLLKVGYSFTLNHETGKPTVVNGKGDIEVHKLRPGEDYALTNGRWVRRDKLTRDEESRIVGRSWPRLMIFVKDTISDASLAASEGKPVLDSAGNKIGKISNLKNRDGGVYADIVYDESTPLREVNIMTDLSWNSTTKEFDKTIEKIKLSEVTIASGRHDWWDATTVKNPQPMKADPIIKAVFGPTHRMYFHDADSHFTTFDNGQLSHDGTKMVVGTEVDMFSRRQSVVLYKDVERGKATPMRDDKQIVIDSMKAFQETLPSPQDWPKKNWQSSANWDDSRGSVLDSIKAAAKRVYANCNGQVVTSPGYYFGLDGKLRNMVKEAQDAAKKAAAYIDSGGCMAIPRENLWTETAPTSPGHYWFKKDGCHVEVISLVDKSGSLLAFPANHYSVNTAMTSLKGHWWPVPIEQPPFEPIAKGKGRNANLGLPSTLYGLPLIVEETLPAATNEYDRIEDCVKGPVARMHPQAWKMLADAGATVTNIVVEERNSMFYGVICTPRFKVTIDSNIASRLAESVAMFEYLEKSAFATSQVRGDIAGRNAEWGLPDYFFGVDIFIREVAKPSQSVVIDKLGGSATNFTVYGKSIPVTFKTVVNSELPKDELVAEATENALSASAMIDARTQKAWANTGSCVPFRETQLYQISFGEAEKSGVNLETVKAGTIIGSGDGMAVVDRVLPEFGLIEYRSYMSLTVPKSAHLPCIDMHGTWQKIEATTKMVADTPIFVMGSEPTILVSNPSKLVEELNSASAEINAAVEKSGRFPQFAGKLVGEPVVTDHGNCVETELKLDGYITAPWDPTGTVKMAVGENDSGGFMEFISRPDALKSDSTVSYSIIGNEATVHVGNKKPDDPKDFQEPITIDAKE
jgi:hypothetical protein